MPINSSPPSRRRGFSTLALLTSGALLFSSTSAGLYALGKSAKAGIAQLERRPGGPFTQSPTKVFLGARPGRDPHGRGGIWTDAMRRAAAASTRFARLRASVAPQGLDMDLHSVAVAPEPGASYPWEGSAPSAGGSVNTGNGDKVTSVHLLDWKIRGGGTLDFTLYHNSQTNYADELGAGWTWTYDVYINNLTTTPTVHWGDGLSVPYSGSGGGTGPGGPTIRGDLLYAALGGFAFQTPSPTTYAAPAGIHDALVQNADGTWAVTKKDGALYAFNAAGFLTSVTDRNGNAITLTLNAQNYVTRITDPTGRYVNVALDANNRFTGITDMSGRSWTFAIDGSGDLSSVTWPDLGDGHTYTDAFAYNGAHQITTHTDRRGKAWTFGYNSDGSLASEADPLGHGTTYGYASSATTVTDALGHASTDNYSSGVQASHVDESGYSTSYTARNASYDVTAWTDARGKAWSATYDSLGNLLTRTDPLGHATTYTYNGFAEPLTATDALGHATTYGYDSAGNLLTVVDARGKTVLTNAYGSYGLASSATDALGHATTFSYDGFGYLAHTTDPTGATTSTQWNARGCVANTTDPAGNVTYHDADEWNREFLVRKQGTNGLSSYVYFAFLPTGEAVLREDGNHHVTQYGHDDAGRLTSVTDPRGDVESYGYDAADRRTSVTNGRGKVRAYAFTDRGDVSSLTMPDGAVEQWSYDGAGNATAYVNGLGQTILYSFDDAGRETLVDYPTGTDTSFGYDAADRRTAMADATGPTTWAYDAANRQTTFSSPQGSQTSAYDDAGRRTGLTGTGLSRAWTYDGAGRPLTLTNESGEATAYAYDGAGRLSTTTLANGQVSTLGYDAQNRETSAVHKDGAGATLSSESYAYDDAGNLSSKAVDGATTAYGYDADDQLTSESRPGYSAGYAYDANGNRASKTLNGVTDSYTVDDGDKLTSVVENGNVVKGYGYDAAGRTTSVASAAGTTTLAYDYEGRVTSVSGPGVGDTFSYNGLDARVGKVEASGPKSFRRDGAEVTAPVLSDGAAVYTPGVSQRRGGATTFDLHDQLGTATRQTDATASLTATRTYDAFGVLLASTGTPQGPFGFAAASGYQEDGDTGLKLLGHRYYDPSTGRFLTRDPAQDGRNWYGYVDNNPLRAVDPLGYFAWALGILALPALPEIAAAAAITVIVVSTAVVATEIYDRVTEARRGAGDDLPIRGGPPDDSLVSEPEPGKGTIRDYDEDGNAKDDNDFGHDHGQGDPHRHPWDWSGPKPVRLPGVPL